MGVHRLEMRAHCSAIDDLAVVRNALTDFFGDEAEIKEKNDKSWHGAPQTNFSLVISRKKNIRIIMSKLGNKILNFLLEDNIMTRIDDRNVIHLRLSLAELCCGKKVISIPRKREPCIKLKIKLEVYPGQSVNDVAKTCINDAIAENSKKK